MKDFNDFLNELIQDTKALAQKITAKIEENPPKNSAELAKALAFENIRFTLETLEAYHRWISRNPDESD